MSWLWDGARFVRGDTVSVADRGLLLGDGLFETIRVEGGAPRRLSRHLDRLRASAAALEIDAPVDEAALRTTIAEHAPAGLAVARLTLTRGAGGRGLEPAESAPTLALSLTPYAAPDAPARLATVSVRRATGCITARHKTLSYADNIAARTEARRAGADEAVMLNASGQPACAAAANLFWIREDMVFTPAINGGALGGITRACVLKKTALAKFQVGAFDASDLARADAAFLTNALMGVRPVSAIDERALDAGHPLIAALARAESEA